MDEKIDVSVVDLKPYYVDDPKPPAHVIETLQKYDPYLTVKWDKRVDKWALLRLAPECRKEGQYFVTNINDYNIPVQRLLQALLAHDLQKIDIDSWCNKLDKMDAREREKYYQDFKEAFRNITAENAHRIFDYFKWELEHNRKGTLRPSKPPWVSVETDWGKNKSSDDADITVLKPSILKADGSIFNPN